MRLGSPQTGSCRARWRNCVSPAAIACGGAPHVAHDQAAEQRETGDRHGDERQHASDDLAAGLASASRRSGRYDRPAGRQWRSTCWSPACAGSSILRRSDNCSRAPISRSRSSSMYLTEKTIGAAALPAQDRCRSRPPPRRRSRVCPRPARSRPWTGPACADPARPIRETARPAARSAARAEDRGRQQARAASQSPAVAGRRGIGRIRHDRSRRRPRRGHGRRRSRSQLPTRRSTHCGS